MRILTTSKLQTRQNGVGLPLIGADASKRRSIFIWLVRRSEASAPKCAGSYGVSTYKTRLFGKLM